MRMITGLSLMTLLLATPVVAQEAQGTFIDLNGAEAGTVSLTQDGDSVAISGHVMGLEPGEHGIHFHTTGDCDSAAKFESAGGHFNPTEHQHGLENPEGTHAGDLPNATFDADGMAMLDLSTDTISLTEGEDGYVFDEDGTALIIHADPDDQMTDPSGNSGDRLVCAVLEAPAAE
ncbi:superoxide dismutase family protein [Devosia rhizoryzae]|uniref:Superoxide dismutase family protein n=1 Tax=Devosia rhizoryzae TaxID=2774137 RepID=A0ABX7CC15_9HYPH|nr:superoxide dismutase family protein [Devosia rhizoryzae]QQR40150.1 superoxide dismutase family protein [Devosia rhizoryzae]